MRQTDPHDRLLLAALRDPARMKSFTAPEWEYVLSQALTVALLGILARLADDAGLDDLPKVVRDQFDGVDVVTDYNRHILSWEANRIEMALKSIEGPVILLKGAAYHLRGIEAVRGRLASDVDILVRKSEIGKVEEALHAAGWSSLSHDAYDEHYYREWMHEIPPLRNDDRSTYVDVHHTILPESGRMTPDIDHLFDKAEPLPDSRLMTLSSADMVLHTIVHCFQDGDMNSRLRDIYDIHGLLTDFGAKPGFWDELLAASDVHGFGRPLYYALYFTQALLGTDIPPDVMTKAAKDAPSAPVMALMRMMVPRAIMPPASGGMPFLVYISRLGLFIRSHWLKMPPLMLFKHLATKAFMRLTGRA